MSIQGVGEVVFAKKSLNSSRYKKQMMSPSWKSSFEQAKTTGALSSLSAILQKLIRLTYWLFHRPFWLALLPVELLKVLTCGKQGTRMSPGTFPNIFVVKRETGFRWGTESPNEDANVFFR